MEIKLIDTTSKRDVNKWVDFPYRLYKGHPFYVPMLKAGQRKLLDRSAHPFYQHSEADFFVTEDNGEVLARISVMENTAYNSYHDEKAAFIGFFDAAENIETARGLFRRVDEWTSGRDLDTIYGPKGLLGAFAGGVLVEGFQYRAALDVPYNYPYYDTFIKDSGYETYRDTLSGHIHRKAEGNIPERVLRISERMAEHSGFYARRFKTKDELRGEPWRLLSAPSASARFSASSSSSARESKWL